MSNVKVPNVLLPDQAVLIATEEELEETSEWMTDGQRVFRFHRVPQFLYNTAAAHLRSRLRKMKPSPPIIRKSGREMTNKADPRYIEALELWRQEWQDLQQEANMSTAMFRGIEIQGGTPPVEEWLPQVLEDFASIGITEEEAYATFYHDKDRLHELWVKKFVVLKSQAVTKAFSDFQGGEDDGVVDIDDGEDTAFAADLFRNDETRDTAE